MDVALPIEPVAEGTYGAVVGVLAVGARQPGQKGIDAVRGKFTVTDEWN